MEITNDTIRACCGIIGIAVGTLLAVEVRLSGRIADHRISAAVLGLMFGVVIGLCVMDCKELIKGHAPEHHEEITKIKEEEEPT